MIDKDVEDTLANLDVGDYLFCSRYVEKLESENRQLKRALWLARAERAFAEMEKYETEAMMRKGLDDKIHKWHNVYRKCRAVADKLWWGKKCRAKADEYKN